MRFFNSFWLGVILSLLGIFCLRHYINSEGWVVSSFFYLVIYVIEIGFCLIGYYLGSRKGGVV